MIEYLTPIFMSIVAVYGIYGVQNYLERKNQKEKDDAEYENSKKN